ncbi:DNA polymerase I [bacterium]|nr:DNA polymerase I [bacterium]
MGKTLILIDGHALAFRQYYALERSNMKTSDGMPTWAVFGFFKAIFDLLKNRNLEPDAICVAFDVSHQTFRVDKYPEYKSNRRAMPDNMRPQMDLIFEGLEAFNIPIYTKEGFEAYDVIGTISKQASELGHNVYILTGDQDSFQLVDKEGSVKVIIPTKGVLVEYDWNKVYEKLGVYPDQVVDYKSLRGDASDNIPGVAGIGDKTATKLLSEYRHLQDILDACPNMPENKFKKCICENLEMAKTSYFLATILRDLDIKFDFESAKIELPDVAKVTAFLKKMQFFSFLKTINSILASFDKKFRALEPQSNLEGDVILHNAGQVQLGLFSETVKAEINKREFLYDAKLIMTIEDLAELVKVLNTKSLIAFRTEATMKSAIDVILHGITIAYNDDFSADERISINDRQTVTKTFYIPLAHYVSEQLSLEEALPYLKPILENEKIKKITHDAKQEHNCFQTFDIDVKGFIFDPFLASYVKDPSRNHSLEVQSLENVEHVLNETLPVIKDAKTATVIANFSLETSLNYVSDVIVTIFELTKYWLSVLDEAELDIVYKIEMPLTIVLARMEYVGVTVDRKYLIDLSTEMADTIRSIEFKIYKLAGLAFNISSPKQVGEVLFEVLGLRPKRKNIHSASRAKYRTGADILEELAETNEIPGLILAYRKFSKLKTTYTDALPSLINPLDGRIHTSYNQTITATGRLSSSNPNLQNIPVRSEEGNKIRKAFVAADRENYCILSADYSQIELRLLAHVSGDQNLIEAFRSGVDVHTVTASKVFGVPVEEITKNMRYRAKAVNFGIVYGQSKFGLSKSLGITVQEADSFITKYFETYPDVKKYMEDMVANVTKDGFVKTLLGRKRYLGAEINSTNGVVRDFAKRAAINFPMQGSAADLIKLAMINLDKKLREYNLKSKLIIQVHDELVLEVANEELDLVKKLVVESMELDQPLLVPLVIDVNIGETWQEL